MNDRPETLDRAAVRLTELAGQARNSAAPVLATRLTAYARAAGRVAVLGWDGLVAARRTLAEDLHRYEAIAPASPLTALARDALAVVSDACA
jgi:hypothetical protein